MGLERYRTICLAIGILAAASGGSRAEEHSDQLLGDFQIGKDGRMVILPVELEGRRIPCLVDTGAGISSFDISLKPLFGPQQGTRVLRTPQEVIRGPAFQWPRATLRGQSLATDQPIVGLDLEEVRQATNLQIQGIIGIDVLKKCRVQFDFDRGIMRFLETLPDDPVSLGHKLNLEFLDAGPPLITGTIGGDRTVQFLIDTGTQGNSLKDSVFDDLLSQAALRAGSNFSSITAAGVTRGERGYVNSLTVGPFTLQDQRVARISFNSLGLRYLSRFLVTFDFPGHAVYLKKGANFDRPEPSATSGMTLLWKDDQTVVEGARRGGPAATAGIRPRDIVVSVNGSSMLPRDPFALRQLLTSTPGRHVSVGIRRTGRDFTVDLVLERD